MDMLWLCMNRRIAQRCRELKPVHLISCLHFSYVNIIANINCVGF